jgi:hypothetical protein
MLPSLIPSLHITSPQPTCTFNWLKPWNERGRDSRRFWKIWMSKTRKQRIPDGVINLSPEQIARDHRLRALYETYLKAKGTPEEAEAHEAFAKFVREEYP